jgi:hypothetical protein
MAAYQYTLTSLTAALQDWAEDDNADFVAAIPEIISKGELKLIRDLDLESFDTKDSTQTLSLNAGTLSKPTLLVSERTIVLSPASGDKIQLTRRSREFVMAHNANGASGTPKYYCDLDNSSWLISPKTSAAYTAGNIDVYGIFRVAGLADGGGSGTSFCSTRFPDLLFDACSIFANEYLKAFNRKGMKEADYMTKLPQARAEVANMARSDFEDLTAGREQQNAAPAAAKPQDT